MKNRLVCFLLFFLPFAILPFGISQYENPKILIAEAVIILILVLSLWRDQIFFKWSKFNLILTGIMGLLTAGQLLFQHTGVSFFGNAFRLQGVFLLWLLLVFSYLSGDSQPTKVPTWVLTGIFIAQIGLTLLLPQNESGRFVGSLGEPNASAAALLFLWPWLYNKSQKNIFKFLVIGLTALTIWGLFQSRSAILGLGIQLVFLGLHNWKVSMKKTLIVCLSLFGLCLGLPWLDKPSIYENRVDIWKVARYAGSKQPIFGQGFGNTELALHQSALELQLPLQYVYVDSSHNLWLDWWVQGGVVGGLVLAGFILKSLKNFGEENEKILLVLLFGAITTLAFNPPSIVGLVQFWWLMGQKA